MVILNEKDYAATFEAEDALRKEWDVVQLTMNNVGTAPTIMNGIRVFRFTDTFLQLGIDFPYYWLVNGDMVGLADYSTPQNVTYLSINNTGLNYLDLINEYLWLPIDVHHFRMIPENPAQFDQVITYEEMSFAGAVKSVILQPRNFISAQTLGRVSEYGLKYPLTFNNNQWLQFNMLPGRVDFIFYLKQVKKPRLDNILWKNDRPPIL